MADELGKLEQKLELLLAPEGPQSIQEQLQRLADQLEEVKARLDDLSQAEAYSFGPGGYSLSPVCEVDSEGNPLPALTAEWPEGDGRLLEVNYKLDALAALAQFGKDLKQPTCGARGSGPASNVTVHFEEG
jgi:hypothetical protein